jgi:large conductance mechanosensitive channel protein
MKKFIAEFKEFINKGNVMDLAVGVIIGGAFQTIVNSLVNDLLMPILGAITGGVHFESWKVTLGAGELENPATLTYGNFIAALINFLLMAIVLFLIVKILNRTRSRIESIGSSDKEEETPTTKKLSLLQI